jgi:Lipid A core - O-antigen ligase and related enzymes
MNKKFLLLIGGILVCVLLNVAYIYTNFKTAVFLIISIYFILISIYNIKYAVVLLLLLRSSIDVFSDKSLLISGVNLNLSSLFAMYCIFMVFIYVVLNKIYIKNNIITAFIIFIVVGFISVILPYNYHLGIVELFKYISILAVYLIILYLNSKEENFDSHITKAIILSSIVPLSVGLYQIIFKKGFSSGFSSEQGLNRVYGTFVHPNSYAFYLLIIVVTIFIYNQKYERNKFFYLLGAVALLELYFTYTRSAWLGMALIVVSYVFLSDISFNKKISFGIFLIILSIPIYNLTYHRFANIFSGSMEESSLATRLYIWKGMFSVFKERPIIGYGIGSFKYYSNIVLNWRIEAHNDYLRLLFETGVIGLLTYMSIQFKVLKNILKYKIDGYKVVSILICTFYLLSLSDNIIDMAVCQWYLWTLIAIYSEKQISI